MRASLSALAILSCVWLSFFSEPACSTVVVVSGVDDVGLTPVAESGVDTAAAGGTLDGVAEAETETEAFVLGAADGVPAAPLLLVLAAVAGVAAGAGSSSMTMKRALDTSLRRLASLLRGGIIVRRQVCVAKYYGYQSR